MKETPPKISVVCAWYERPNYIRDTIDSLLKQDYPNFEIVLINDGSPDPRVREHFDRYHDQRIHLFHQKNTGFTRAIRHAIDASDGEYIAIQGAGDISHHTRLSIQAAILQTNTEISALGTGCTQVAATRNLRRRYFSPQRECTKTSLLKNMPFVHGTTMFRRERYDEIGGYDVRFEYCSDWDLFFRLVDTGKIVGIDEPLYEQRMFMDGFSFSPQHKFKQLWYKERAINRTPESRKLLDNSEDITQRINPSNPQYLSYTLLTAIKSFAKGDVDNFRQWIELAIKQIISKLTAFIR